MKRGQAALEFIMTYGWAILVVLIAVGLLAYFGVLNFKYLDSCILPQGLDCIDKPAIYNTYIEIASKNNLAFPINITDVTISAGKGVGTLQTVDLNGVLLEPAKGVLVRNNEGFRARMNFDTIYKGQVRIDFLIKYTNTQTGIDHSASGYIVGENK